MIAHPVLPGHLAGAELFDQAARWPVAASHRRYDTDYLALDVDTIAAPDASTHERAVVRPRDAIGVLALDDADRVLLVTQYRHAVGQRLVEIPAGIMDVAGESPQEAARRELAEEADLVADDWCLLAQSVVTPGYSTERWTIFRATGLRPLPEAERTVRVAEEADMQQWWLAFGDALAAVLDGRVSDVQTGLAVLHEWARRTSG